GLAGPVAVTAVDCVFHDNTGSMLPNASNGDGGALMIKGSLDRLVEVEVERCEFTANYNAQGAGIYIGRYATGFVRRCRFVGNRAWYQGGAAMKGGALVYNYGETATFDSCEFVGNEAGYTPDGAPTGEYSRGGALMVRNLPRAVVRHCTFVDNRVSEPGLGWGDAFAHPREGGSWGADNRCVLVNSVFWGDGHDVQVRSDDGGLEQAARLALEPGQFSAPGTVQEGFVWLATYPLTGAQDFVPAAGSPLLDQALDLGFTIDLAGVAVPQGPAPDIGAYERPAGPAAVPPPAPAASLAAWPNPFNPRTVVTATLTRAGTWRLAVFDLRGRRVTVLHRGHLDPGTYAWPWDARDPAGRPLPSGIYLARLTGPAAPITTRLTLLR
ncbi:MAG: choice-of-anchor Q domain-containing protein, partial [Candidatus Krumholzibacteriia bacterium]